MKPLTVFVCAVVLILAADIRPVLGHSRLVCPRPRSDSAGLKDVPCGGTPTTGAITTFSPGLNTIVFEETISHSGAPFRVALAFGDDVYDYVLLNHIPHNDGSQSGSTKPYRLNIDIPDVKCDSCSLQLGNPMVGSSACTFDTRNQPSCSIYVSCANIQINGTKSVAEFKASYSYSAPSWWPYTSTSYSYNLESAVWSSDWLSGQNNTNMGPCADITSLSQYSPFGAQQSPQSGSTAMAPNTGVSSTVASVLFCLAGALIVMFF